MKQREETPLAARVGAPRGAARDVAMIALISALIIAGRAYLRIPMHVPGHSGVIWMALLVVGKAASGKRWGGTLIGLVTGILALAIVPGKEGVLTGLKYLAPGITLDLITPLLGGRLDKPWTAAIAASVAHVAKNITALLVGWALGIPAGFLVVGVGGAMTLHAVFGFIGGWLGALLIVRLRRHGLLGGSEQPR